MNQPQEEDGLTPEHSIEELGQVMYKMERYKKILFLSMFMIVGSAQAQNPEEESFLSTIGSGAVCILSAVAAHKITPLIETVVANSFLPACLGTVVKFVAPVVIRGTLYGTVCLGANLIKKAWTSKIKTEEESAESIMDEFRKKFLSLPLENQAIVLERLSRNFNHELIMTALWGGENDTRMGITI